MTRFLTLLAVTCFALVAWGQQTPALIGLPEYGVTLTGTVPNPAIVNNSGKGLIGYVLRFEYASGRSDYRRTLQTRGLRLNVPALGLSGRRHFLDLLQGGVAIPPGGAVSLEYPAAVTVISGIASTTPVTVRVAPDALIFADSQFVGMGHSFEVLTNQLLAEQELAQLVSAARNDATKRDAAWAEVTRLAQPYGERSLDREYELSDIGQVQLARDLVFAKNRAGEDATYDVADRGMAIPKLLRAQQ